MSRQPTPGGIVLRYKAQDTTIKQTPHSKWGVFVWRGQAESDVADVFIVWSGRTTNVRPVVLRCGFMQLSSAVDVIVYLQTSCE